MPSGRAAGVNCSSAENRARYFNRVGLPICAQLIQLIKQLKIVNLFTKNLAVTFRVVKNWRAGGSRAYASGEAARVQGRKKN